MDRDSSLILRPTVAWVLSIIQVAQLRISAQTLKLQLWLIWKLLALQRNLLLLLKSLLSKYQRSKPNRRMMPVLLGNAREKQKSHVSKIQHVNSTDQASPAHKRLYYRLSPRRNHLQHLQVSRGLLMHPEYQLLVVITPTESHV